MGKSIKKNFLYNTILNVSSVIFPLITAPYVARVLEPDGVGLANFATTYSGYFALVAMLGLPNYGIREVSKVREDKELLTKLVSELMSIAVIATLIVSTLYTLSVFLIDDLSSNLLIFILAGFVVYLAPFRINWYYQGIENFGFITFRSLIIRVISICCLFLFVREKEDVQIYVLLNILGTVVADVWNYLYLLKQGIKPSFTFTGLKQHVKPLLILLSSALAVSIYTVLDTLMLGFMTNYDEVGYYSNATHITKTILTIVISLSIVAVPRIADYAKNNEYDKINELVNKSFSFIVFISFPMSFGLMLITPTFIPLFLGEQFVGAVIPMMILSFLLISIGMNNLISSQALLSLGFDKLLFNTVIYGAIANFIINCILIPKMGAIGASISSLIAETSILFFAFHYAYRNTQIRVRRWGDVFKSLIGSLLFFPLLFGFKLFLSGWVLVIVFIIMGAALYIFVEGLLKNESMVLFIDIVKSKLESIKNK